VFLIDQASAVLAAQDLPGRQQDPFSQLACSHVDGPLRAVRQRHGRDARIGLVVANCFGGWTFCDPQAGTLATRGPRAVSAYLSVAWFPAAAQGQITIGHHLRVPALTFSSRFFAFQDALAVAGHWLATGAYDAVLACAAESAGSPFLAGAVGPGAVNDVVVWFALAAEGGGTDTRLRLSRGAPPPLPATELSEPVYRGTPTDGACALPLLMLAALDSTPSAWRVPGRALVHAHAGTLDLWRLA
jgi:hypothetical protein